MKTFWKFLAVSTTIHAMVFAIPFGGDMLPSRTDKETIVMKVTVVPTNKGTHAISPPDPFQEMYDFIAEEGFETLIEESQAMCTVERPL